MGRARGRRARDRSAQGSSRDWNIYAAQASDGDNSISTRVTGRTSDRNDTDESASLLPIGSTGESNGSTFESRIPRLGRVHGCAPTARRCRAKVSDRSEIFPVFTTCSSAANRRRKPRQTRTNMTRQPRPQNAEERTAKRLLRDGLGVPDLQRIHDAARRIARTELGLTMSIQPDRDHHRRARCWKRIPRPHAAVLQAWSFGTHFAHHEAFYRRVPGARI